jgi:hypothetical protein
VEGIRWGWLHGLDSGSSCTAGSVGSRLDGDCGGRHGGVDLVGGEPAEPCTHLRSPDEGPGRATWGEDGGSFGESKVSLNARSGQHASTPTKLHCTTHQQLLCLHFVYTHGYIMQPNPAVQNSNLTTPPLLTGCYMRCCRCHPLHRAQIIGCSFRSSSPQKSSCYPPLPTTAASTSPQKFSCHPPLPLASSHPSLELPGA